MKEIINKLTVDQSLRMQSTKAENSTAPILNEHKLKINCKTESNFKKFNYDYLMIQKRIHSSFEILPIIGEVGKD